MPAVQWRALPASQRRTVDSLRLDLTICAFLLLATLAVYSQVHSYEFVNFDDPDYVTENAHVRGGITEQSVRWAFTSSYTANWIPLTWLSHMLDCDMFGLQSGQHHLTNVLLHALSVLLLYAFLRRATGAIWRSALVASLFALHPLHVESVAWISERKDVLSGFLWFLTLWLYMRYTERQNIGRYLFVVAAFSFGLMAKAMIVTLPLALLLIDTWPLRRKLTLRLITEKAPLLCLSAAVSIVTYVVQQRGGAVIALSNIPLAARVENAVVSCLTYIVQMFLPVRLAVFYPFAPQPIWEVTIALLFVAAISMAALRWRREHSYLAVGWFWYLITLAPVIGVVQVGEQAHADRYTYIPLVGIFIMLAWGGAEVADRWPKTRLPMATIATAGCAACLVLTSLQIQYWRNSTTLFEHALKTTSGNYVAYTNLGLQLRSTGRTEEAAQSYLEALKARPHFVDAENDLGEARLAQGRPSDALPYLVDALRVKPDFVEAHINLGSAFEKLSQPDRAAAEYGEALKFQPGNAVAHAGLGQSLADLGRTEEAARELQNAISIDPNYAEAHFSLGLLAANLGRSGEAIAQFSDVIRLRPDDADAHYNLGTALGSEGRLAEAVEQFNIALKLRPADANIHLNLGKALANMGRLSDAAAHFAEALRIDPNLAEARDSLNAVRR